MITNSAGAAAPGARGARIAVGAAWADVVGSRQRGGAAVGKGRRWTVLLGLIGALGAAPAAATGQADGWPKLHAAVQRWRVGELDGVGVALARLQAGAEDKDVRAAAAFVSARVHARLRQGAAAQKALRAAKSVGSVLAAAYRWAEIEVLIAANEPALALDRLVHLRRDEPEFRWAAADLLWVRLLAQVQPGAATAAAALERYDAAKAHLNLPRDELLAIAARHQEATQPEAARGTWKKLLLLHPESPHVAEAQKHVAEDTLTDAEQFGRMERLFARRAYESCRAVAQKLWDKGLRRSEVGYYLGKIATERLRDDYPGAATYLEAAVADGAPLAQQALPSYALVLTKLGKLDEGLAQFDTWFARFPGASREKTVDVAYDRARAMHGAGRSLEAAAYLQAALDVDRKGIDFGKYLWFVGYWQIRGGACEVALQTLDPLLADRNPLVGGKTRYWLAKCLDKLGKRPEAVDMLVSLLNRHPLTWYSALGEDLLVAWGEGHRVPQVEDLSAIAVAPRDPFGGLPASPELRRLRVAAHLGEPDTARLVLAAVRPKLQRKLGKVRLARLEAQLADVTEQFADDRQAALRANEDVLQRAPTRDTVAIWRAIYPRAYATHVVAAAKRTGAPEWMIYAHMLQESRYRPWLISGAPAYGLLELLDRTAARLAADAGDDYQLWMLMLPQYNIRWGAQYLGALYAKFGQQLPFAIASYNGGPMLLEHHLRAAAARHLALDELIDDIGPHETRNYVRMVIGHFLRYLAIYETPARARQFRQQLLPYVWKAEWLPAPNY